MRLKCFLAVCLTIFVSVSSASAKQASPTKVEVSGSLQSALDALVANGTYNNISDITSLSLSGTLGKDDWSLIKKMCTSGNGYNLRDVDLTDVTNDSIDPNQFADCTLLRSIVFPKALRGNGERVCNNCSNLESAKFNEGVTYICNHFFNGCSKLSEVWIPSTVGYLYGSVFEKCTGLKKIHLQCKPLQILEVARSPLQPRNVSQVFMNNPEQPKSSTLYVPTEYVSYYKSLLPSPENVTNSHLADYLSALDEKSDEWTSGTDAFDWKPGKASLRGDFVWANSSTVVEAEDSWDGETTGINNVSQNSAAAKANVVEVYTLGGVKVKTLSKSAQDLSSLGKGIYILKSKNYDNTVETRKLIIK